MESQSREPSFVAHPWHSVSPGPNVPNIVTCYIEIGLFDSVKYELDKASGLLRVDRPQRYSNVPPSLYGFIPKTYCREQVAARCMERTGKVNVIGDGDPLDVCVLTEKPIAMSNILVDAIPIGGFRMVDRNEADDKIIAVMKNDIVWGGLRDIENCPSHLFDRLRHYFLTYKQSPDDETRMVEIAEVYGQAEAHEVIRRSLLDYVQHYP